MVLPRSLRRVASPFLVLALPALAPAQTAGMAGQVTSAEERIVLGGVQVVALLDGVTPVGQALTGEDGRFELELPLGEYDLRAVATGKPYLAGFKRDVELRLGERKLIDFELQTFEHGLASAGLDPEWLLDGDRDGIPDRTERATNSDHRAADTDADGVADGLATWVGAHPKLGAARTQAEPSMLWPPPMTALPLLPTVPFELLFQPVPGATGYRLVVESTDEELRDVRDVDVKGDSVLLGEACALRWSPPRTWIPGAYRFILRGYYGEPGKWLGSEAVCNFSLFEVDRIDPLVVEGEHELKGMVIVSTLHLRPEAEISVPKGEVLHLIATDDVLVEEEVKWLGEAGDDEDPPAHVRLSCAKDVRIFGTLTTGAGAPGQDALTLPSGYGNPSAATGTPGGPGGGLVISSRGKVVIGREALVASGDGGRGGDARAEADPAYDALAIGGRGGPAGHLIVHADALVIADRPGRLRSGQGGAGGSAVARGGDGDVGVRAGLSSALPGVGGDAGDLWLSDFDLRRDGFVALGDPSYPVLGGVAGALGSCDSRRPEPGTGKSKVGLDGREHEVICTEVGGGGWSQAGQGQGALAFGGEGLNAGNGGLAKAISAPGGRVHRLGMRYSEVRLRWGFVPQAGTGGPAEAHGGEPGFGASTAHGSGGHAWAQAGPGGPGLTFPSHVVSRGGVGGHATALAKDGLHGRDRCPRTGQDGSDGGFATALSGSGGFANGVGGDAGASEARGGRGGDGGRGTPEGRGGKGGDGRTTPGDPGSGWLANGGTLPAKPIHGARGERGKTCPN